MSKRIGFSPNNYGTSGGIYNSVKREYGLGMKYDYLDAAGNICTARYVQFIDAVAYAQGNICFWADDYVSATATPLYKVTVDYSESLGDVLMPVGVCYGAQTQNYYGFIQIAGPGYILHNNDDDAAIGSELIATAADNGVANVGTRTPMTGVGYGLIAVVAATNLQWSYIQISNH